MNPVAPHDRMLDFALLQRSVARSGARNRVALLGLLGFLALLVASVVMLVLYLRSFEAEETNRRRAADAQWLEQTARFHFRRLEDDLLVLARHALTASIGADARGPDVLEGGWLWRAPGVVLTSGWLPAQTARPAGGMLQRWQRDRELHPDNAADLARMQSTSVGLRRASYAGPMRDANASFSDVVWLAVPFFDRGQWVGSYLAALSMNTALQAMIPSWYLRDHAVRLLSPSEADPGSTQAQEAAMVLALDLPGVDLLVELTQSAPDSTTVPRVFLGVAMLFLMGMLLTLWVLRRDLAKRQQIQSLLEAQVALRLAMENSVTIGLRAWDLDGRILYVNEAFCRMVGYAATELIGTAMPFPYWPEQHRSQLAQVHREIMSRGTDGQGLEIQFQHRNGQLIDVLINEAPLTTADGTQIGWMSSVLDISERKRAQRLAAAQQDALEASGRLIAVGEVASTLAHELNQPLGALASFANGLLNRISAGSIRADEVAPVVERMARLAERAGAIIRRVGDFARRRELSRQRVDMVALVQRVVDGEREPQAALHWDAPPGPIWVLADALLLEHLVANLLDNALFWATQGQAAQGPQVALSVQADADGVWVRLQVGDNGPGVAAELVESIFRAFVSRREGGMGMGLAICRSIVEAHHGQIRVGTDPLLGGALFVAELPMAPAPESQSNVAPDTALSAQTTAKTVA
ncbi:MAG: PAS domain S-box protein [Rhodoferax sp.]